MAEGLAAVGCDVDIVTTDDNATEKLSVPFDRPVKENGVTYYYFPRQTHFYIVSLPLWRWLGQNIARYDVVHIHALFSFAVAAGAWWAQRNGVPYVVRPLGTLNRWGIENRRPWLKQLSLRLIDGKILTRAAAVHYTSDEERDEAAAAVPFKLNPVIIPNPVDFEVDRQRIPGGWLVARYPETAGKKVVLFLSRLHEKKGLDLLLSSFAAVRAQMTSVVLVLGGNGEERFVEQLRRQAAQLGIKRDIIWAGFLDGKDKKSVIAEADIFVLPSYSENFGVAVVEAMAAGLPVIVSDCVGLHREISRAEAGVVVPCKEKPLSEAILRLLTDAQLRASLSRNGQVLAESFTPRRVAGKLVELYQKIGESSGWRPGIVNPEQCQSRTS